MNQVLYSVAGHFVGAGSAVYAGTKFTVRAISEGLRKEEYGNNIRSTIISPGMVMFELPESITDMDFNHNCFKEDKVVHTSKKIVCNQGI